MKDKIGEYLKNQINQSADYYHKWLYPNGGEFGNIYQINLTSLDCDMDGNDVHNCVSCNLHEGSNLINQFLENHRNCGQTQYFVTLYSLIFYLQAERLGFIYKELGYINNKGDFDWEKFPVLQKIKYWANFFKHPKSAMLLHHTSYYIVSCPNNPNGIPKGLIDFEFIKTYYSGSKKNSQLDKLLSNKEYNVYYPDLFEFTKELCSEFEKIIEIINSNEENKEKLKKYQKENLDYKLNTFD